MFVSEQISETKQSGYIIIFLFDFFKYIKYVIKRIKTSTINMYCLLLICTIICIIENIASKIIKLLFLFVFSELIVIVINNIAITIIISYPNW